MGRLGRRTGLSMSRIGSGSPAYSIVLFEPLSLVSVIKGLPRQSGVRSLTGVSSRVRIWQGAFTGLESIAGLQAPFVRRALPPP
jgi:hypothetical protein